MTQSLLATTFDATADSFERERFTVLEEIRKEALRQLETEIAKLFDLRIYPYGCVYPDKSLFDTTKKKLYLIDFEDWRKSPKDQPFDRNKSLKYDY